MSDKDEIFKKYQMINESKYSNDDGAGEESKEYRDYSDADPDFELARTNFPHGAGYPNPKRSYEAVVRTDYISGPDDSYDEKFNNTYKPLIIDFVKKEMPESIDKYNLEDYADMDGLQYRVNMLIPGDESGNAMREKFHKLLDYIYGDSPNNPDNKSNYPLFVTLYDTTRLFGGHEEGGWWYDYNDKIQSYKVTAPDQVEKVAKHLYNNLRQYDLDGQPRIYLERKPGSLTKQERPNYE